MRPLILLLLGSGFLSCATQPDPEDDSRGIETRGSVTERGLDLENEALRVRWRRGVDGHLAFLDVQRAGAELVRWVGRGHAPRVVLGGGRVIDLAPAPAPRLEDVAADPDDPRAEARAAGRRWSTTIRDDTSGLDVTWSAELRDGSTYVVQALELTAAVATPIDSLVFLNAQIPDARQVGEVDGSVVVAGTGFFAVEHPLAKNEVDGEGNVRLVLPRGNTLRQGETWRFTSVIGVVPDGQLRRGFLSYLERRRAHPYRPFLHYNSWYHLNIGRPDNHMTEAEALAAIADLGRELVAERGVELDAFVWDDGWDDFDSLWGFHADFPHGFARTREAAAAFGAGQGVWMSPWGGYGAPKERRVAHGRAQGYETNANGFAMGGAKYGAAFREVCRRMMREHGVSFFKFDGMGSGNSAGGAQGELSADIDAVLRLAGDLRVEKPDVFLSATVGTWASPFWIFHADSIWRQGGDTGFHGPGNGREQWITYRDMFTYRRVVQRGPLYPLNSLMLHGPCIGERADPAKMERDEASVAHEFWTFFGSGTGLQELYISPHLLTETMWDELAAAAKWSRAHTDVLVDSHWIGGDPGELEVYGFASWSPRKGILVLRNPADGAQDFTVTLQEAWELPPDAPDRYHMRRIVGGAPAGVDVDTATPRAFRLPPFHVEVWEGEPLR